MQFLLRNKGYTLLAVVFGLFAAFSPGIDSYELIAFISFWLLPVSTFITFFFSGLSLMRAVVLSATAYGVAQVASAIFVMLMINNFIPGAIGFDRLDNEGVYIFLACLMVAASVFQFYVMRWAVTKKLGLIFFVVLALSNAAVLVIGAATLFASLSISVFLWHLFIHGYLLARLPRQ